MNISTCFCRIGFAVFFAVTFTVSFMIVPHALGANTPFVKEVAYYKDWQLTKSLSGTVRPGTTFFIKVVFSEPMTFKTADNNKARPILYYRINGELIRFRIAKHGAGGADFVSGDGKPLQGGVDDYICKYTVPAEVMGEFTFAIGKLNTDRDGNTLPGFYTHPEKLHLGQAVGEPSPAETTPPTAQEPQQLVDTMPLDGGNVIEVYMPDENLRKVVVAKINEQAALEPYLREVPEESYIQIGTKKPSAPIYEPEMRLIGTLKAEAAGIEDLTGLEYAINLKQLYLGNPYGRTWNSMTVPLEEGTEAEPKFGYRVTKPEMPNQISDITPLSKLRKLESLDLGYNAISDLRPLASLENLRWLGLAENNITDISPLGSLTNLTFLSLRNDYYSPEWAGNNTISNLSPLGNLSKLETLYVDHNPIMGRIEVVQSLLKLKNLSVGCCGVSNLRLFLEHPRLGQTGGMVYLVHSPLTAADVPDLDALAARGVQVEDGIFWRVQRKEGFIAVEAVPYGTNLDHIASKTFAKNNVEKCSVSYRESLRAAPTLQSQLRTETGVLSSLWHDLSHVPEETALLPNYPNPFNPETWIPYQLAKPARVTVSIYATDGRFVRTFALGYKPAGVYQSKGRAAYWDGRNELGEPVASGLYFYTFTAGDFTATRKMLIRK